VRTREFTLTRLGPCQQQICDVRAGNEQHECDRQHQRAQSRAESAEQFFVERRHFHSTFSRSLSG
jgi:hypothetical protein